MRKKKRLNFFDDVKKVNSPIASNFKFFSWFADIQQSVAFL